MTLKSIPISSVRTFLPFLDFMIEIGAPVERWLERFRLPNQIHEDPDGFIPTRHYWDFVAFSTRKEGVEDLGVRLGHDHAYQGLGRRVTANAHAAPTLLVGIERFARLVRGEYSGMQVWLSDAGEDTVQLNLKKSFEPETPGFFQTEWLGVIVLVKLVQLFAGRRWQPDEIALRSSRQLIPLACGLYPDVRFKMGQPESRITFARDLLSLGPCDDGAAAVSKLEALNNGRVPRDVPEHFTDSLQRLLATYLRDGCPSVDFAAELAGLSRRTLQRRLDQVGVSYSNLVDRTRFEIATHLLSETDASSLEIAFEVGYEDPSHFARMFRRIAGCSPREYRRRHSADSLQK